MKSHGTIYVITNKITGEQYVGKTVGNLAFRWSKHISDTNRGDHKGSINKAIKEFGAENFEISVLEVCPKDSLNDRETFWINELDTFKKGYNDIISSGKDENTLLTMMEEWLRGTPITSLATKYNICRKTFAKFLKSKGYDSSANQKYKFDPNKYNLAREMYLNGKSIQVISKELSMCRKALGKKFREDGLIVLLGQENRYRHPYK